MPQHHIGPYSLNQGLKTLAYYSVERPSTIVIFVHGFGGNSITTWNNFSSIITDSTDFRNSDIIFYGYDSYHSQVSNLGLRLYKFLQNIVKPVNNAQNRRRGIEDEFSYDRIVLVGHSLGAIVVRRALLNAKIDREQWLNSCRMVLFAPAHRGARVQRLLIDSLPGIAKVFAGLGQYMYPITMDLQPNSVALQNLSEETNALLNANEGAFTVAHSVFWAEYERIVFNDRFCQDPIAVEIRNRYHTDICKPTFDDYMDPVSHVLNAINQ